MTIDFYRFIDPMLSSPNLLLVIKLFVIIFKIVFVIGLSRLSVLAKAQKKLWAIIIALLCLTIVIDLGWFAKLLRMTFIPSLSYGFVLSLIRLGWLCSIIEYASFTLFLDALTNPTQHFRFTPQRLFLWSLGGFLALAQCGIMSFYFATSGEARPEFEFILYKLIYFYFLFALVSTFVDAWRSSRSGKLPAILKMQLQIFVLWIVMPHAILELMSLSPFAFFHIYKQNFYPLMSLSTILLTYGLYFSAKRILRLRFLNITSQIEITYNTNFINDFKETLEQLAHVTNLEQIERVTQIFFKKALKIENHKAHIFYRTTEAQASPYRFDAFDKTKQHVHLLIEHTLTEPNKSELLKEFMYHTKILMRDDLEFSNFYERDSHRESVIDFLKSINADVFVPIYEKQMMIGYLLVEHNARPGTFFSAADRDEMLILSTYLGTIINLLQHVNYHALLKEQKQLKEELYNKHQEINQYKESLRSFLRSTKERKIGILFYKNRRFSLVNQAAHELLGVDVNLESGHELTQTLKKVAKDVQTYKASQSLMAKNSSGKKLVVMGIPSLGDTYAIIAVYYPELADTLLERRDLVKDPSEWDYALYLETTASGKLINTLIPGNGEILINFKIDLLKAALNRKALLINMPDDDIRPTVEIIHHISLRTDLHILKLPHPEKNHEVAIKLFGINPLFGAPEETALLEKLNAVGTLFIENVHFLSMETQQALAECISYGYFRPLRSDRKIMTQVRVICSTHQNLASLVTEGLFSAALLQELNQTVLRLPTLISLQPSELHSVMDTYVEQALETHDFKNLLELSDREKERIINQKPLSLQEFKECIQQVIMQKSAKGKIDEVVFEQNDALSDPELHQAVRLGKHALKDRRMMTMLWSKFKNQTKIATLLNVNRSSVNRRCKEFNLLD